MIILTETFLKNYHLMAVLLLVSGHRATKRCENDQRASNRIASESAPVLFERSDFWQRIFLWLPRETIGNYSSLFSSVFLRSVLRTFSCCIFNQIMKNICSPANQLIPNFTFWTSDVFVFHPQHIPFKLLWHALTHWNGLNLTNNSFSLFISEVRNHTYSACSYM